MGETAEVGSAVDAGTATDRVVPALEGRGARPGEAGVVVGAGFAIAVLTAVAIAGVVTEGVSLAIRSDVALAIAVGDWADDAREGGMAGAASPRFTARTAGVGCVQFDIRAPIAAPAPPTAATSTTAPMVFAPSEVRATALVVVVTTATPMALARIAPLKRA